MLRVFRPSPALGEVWLSPWQATGLIKLSAIKPVFATLEQAMIIRQLATISSRGQAAVKKPSASILT